MLKTLKKTLFISFSLLIPLSLANVSYSETIVTPIGQQSSASVDKPINGMSKAQVKNRYGSPSFRKAPVGSPPISSWVYNGFTVYFEYNTVIHSVATYSNK